MHNKAIEPPQNLDLPISHTGIGCKIGKTAAFWVADPTSPASILYLLFRLNFSNCCFSLQILLLLCEMETAELSGTFLAEAGASLNLLSNKLSWKEVCTIPLLYQSLFSDAWMLCIAFLS